VSSGTLNLLTHSLVLFVCKESYPGLDVDRFLYKQTAQVACHERGFAISVSIVISMCIVMLLTGAGNHRYFIGYLFFLLGMICWCVYGSYLCKYHCLVILHSFSNFLLINSLFTSCSHICLTLKLVNTNSYCETLLLSVILTVCRKHSYVDQLCRYCV